MGLILLFVLIGLSVPIAVATGVIGVLGIWVLIGLTPALKVAGWVPYSALASFTWVTLPMFVLMGEFAMYSGVSERAFAASYKWLGHVRGGLGMAVTASCALFAACSGSSIASTAIMARIALPELEKFKYNKSFATGLIAASGTLAALIPPSMLMIVYSMLTQVSLVKLLLAGFIPGFLSAVIYMTMIHMLFRFKPQLGPVVPPAPWPERWKSLPGISGIALIMLFVVGGMYTGVFTASEAAATGAILTLCMAFLHGELKYKNVKQALDMAGVTTSQRVLHYPWHASVRQISVPLRPAGPGGGHHLPYECAALGDPVQHHSAIRFPGHVFGGSLHDGRIPAGGVSHHHRPGLRPGLVRHRHDEND